MQPARRAVAARHHCRFCRSGAIFPRSIYTPDLGADSNIACRDSPDEEPFIWPTAGRISFVPRRNLRTAGSPTPEA
jgi:hypothetical protein